MIDRQYYKSIGKSVSVNLISVFWRVSLIILFLSGTFINATRTVKYEYGIFYNYSVFQFFWFKFAIPGVIAAIIGFIFFASRILSSPLTYGEKTMYLYTLSYKEGINPAPAESLAYNNARRHYTEYLSTEIIMEIKLFLWTLLLIVPGIIKAYEYFLIPYIKVMNPNISFDEAKIISARRMNGYKWSLFVMQLSFIGWEILNALTAGLLGAFWLRSYEQATFAAWVTSLNLEEEVKNYGFANRV